MDLVSTHPTDLMSNVIHDILLLVVEIHTDGLGFSKSYISYRKIIHGPGGSWDYFKDKCSGKIC